MKKLNIRSICGDYALDIGFNGKETFTLYFNSKRNAETVKRCIEADDSVPNDVTPVDFVEVVRCKDCKYAEIMFILNREDCLACSKINAGYRTLVDENFYCGYAERNN